MTTNRLAQQLIFKQALLLSQLAIYAGQLAIVCFVIFGTLASMAHFKDSSIIYYAFHYLPYALIIATIPILLYHSFLMNRYRIIQRPIIIIMLAMGIALPIIAGVFYYYQQFIASNMAVFLAVIVWFAMPYLFKVNIIRFLNFLTEGQSNDKSTPP